MSRPVDNLDDALQAAISRGLDALTPDQVERLAAILDERPDLAAQLADRIPVIEPQLADALAQAERQSLPSTGAWSRAWDRIAAAQPKVARRPRVGPQILRLWRPLAAVAACLVLAAAWWIGTPRPPTAPPLRLATDLEIDRLEVYDGDTPFVVSIGDSGAVIIWVLEERS